MAKKMVVSVAKALFYALSVVSFIKVTYQATCYTAPTSLVNEILCDNFTLWSDLNSYLTNFAPLNSTFTVSIRPLAPFLILTDDLNFATLISVFHSSASNPVNTIDLLGVDLLSWQMGGSVSVVFEQSLIDFYLNGTLASRYECTYDIIPAQYVGQTFFNSFYSIGFNYKNKYPKLPICPYLFANASINSLLLFGLVDNSILINNLWQFENNITSKELNETVNIGCNINILQVSGYSYALDTRLMHPVVFNQTEKLIIARSIGTIQPDLFTHFKQILAVYVDVENFANFFHRLGIAWTFSLAMGTSVVFAKYNGSFSSWIDGGLYTYPDSDFCLFSHWPHQNGIIPIFVFTYLSVCTSTIRWLLFNYFNDSINTQALFEQNPTSEEIYSICANSNFWKETLTNNTSYFEQRIELCNLTQNNGSTTIYAELYQVRFITEFIQDLIEFCAIPLLSVIGLFFNVIIIWIINKNKEKELKDQFYKYMQLNAFFNCLYCLLFLFYPINSCANSMSTYFCSSIRQSYVTQLYKIIFLAYFGESIKMCANISFILITVNRYMLIGKDGHLALFEKISKWNMKKVICISILVSLILNIGHIWQYFLNKKTQYLISLFSDGNIYVYDTYPAVDRIDTGVWFYVLSIYFIIYFVINNLLFWLVNTLVEVVLVHKLHNELKEKKNRMVEMTSSNPRTSASLAQPMSFRKRRKKEMDDRAEQRTIIMVVTNSLLNFFLRISDVIELFSIASQVFVNNSQLFLDFNSFPSFSFLTTDFAYSTYILTFTANFFMFYLFNQKFRGTFSQWTHVKPK